MSKVRKRWVEEAGNLPKVIKRVSKVIKRYVEKVAKRVLKVRINQTKIGKKNKESQGLIFELRLDNSLFIC